MIEDDGNYIGDAQDYVGAELQVEYEVRTLITLIHRDSFFVTRSLKLDEEKKAKTICAFLYNENKKFVGRVRIAETKYGFYESHAALNDAYQNHGLGSKLYVCAIKYALSNGIVVRSSTNPSDMALRVWNGKTMNDVFEIKKLQKRYHIVGLKNV